MDSVTIKVEGIDELMKELHRRGDEVKSGIKKIVAATALDVRRDVIRRHNTGPKTGTLYKRGNVEHIASAPGEAPAVDQGTLVSSIYFEQPRYHTAIVGSRLAYAFYLEFGSSVTDYRPSWVPAVEKMRPKLTARAQKLLRSFAR